MSKHALFMVHGMGEQKDGWHKPAVSQLRRAWKIAGLQQQLGGTFDKFYEVHPHLYAQRFQDYWKNYRDKAEQLAALNLSGAPDIIQAVFRVASATPGDNPLLTHWADVLLYAASGFNELIAEELIVRLREASFDNFSIIAHSLGTRVTHDALQRGYSEHGDSQLFGKATVLLCAANVSRLMSLDDAEFRKPGYKVFPSEQRRDGACEYFINTHHWLDAIGSIRPFKIHPADISPGFSARNYISKPLPTLDLFPGTRMNTLANFLADVHSLENHLAHPSVYVPLFNKTMRPDPLDPPLIDDHQYQQLLANYQAATPTGEVLAHSKNIRSELREVGYEAREDQLDSIASVMDSTLALLRLLRSIRSGG